MKKRHGQPGEFYELESNIGSDDNNDDYYDSPHV